MSVVRRLLHVPDARPVILAIALVGCGGPSASPVDGGSQPAAGSSSGSAATSTELDCDRLGYPCDLSETPPHLLERTTELLAEARERARSGTMADALSMLRDAPDVVDAFGSDMAITFRVEGAPPAWLVDHGLDDEGRPAQRPTHVAGLPPPAQLASVVGEDTTGDGQIDNRDAKRALILAPYLWEFAPHDESVQIRSALQATPGYADDVRLRANRTEGEQNITLADWFSFDEYDAIFIGTHGYRECSDPVDTAANVCRTVVETGVTVNVLDMASGGDLDGFWPMDVVGSLADTDPSAAPPTVTRLGVSLDFFRLNYPGGLDDTFLSLSACETGSVAGEEWAAAAGGDDFVMMAWSETVPAEDAFEASLEMLKWLRVGLTSEQAYQAVVDAGLAVAEYEGTFTTLELISPGNDEVRLIELPTLLADGAPVMDGHNLSHSVRGIPGDGDPDEVELDLRVMGIHDRPLYSVRYEIDGRPTIGSYGLGAAEEGEHLYSYLVTHVVEVGFDLPVGDDISLTVIVDLPEGGESRYAVDVVLRGEGAIITVGNQTWEFEPTEFWQCFVDDDSLHAGDLNADGADFGASLHADGKGNVQVRGGSPRQRWSADADREVQTVLHLLPAGSSGIDTITIENGRAWGQATFIETNAAVDAWSNNHESPDWPPSVPGTFDIRCGG